MARPIAAAASRAESIAVYAVFAYGVSALSPRAQIRSSRTERNVRGPTPPKGSPRPASPLDHIVRVGRLKLGGLYGSRPTFDPAPRAAGSVDSSFASGP